jgi:hypothetical protein
MDFVRSLRIPTDLTRAEAALEQASARAGFTILARQQLPHPGGVRSAVLLQLFFPEDAGPASWAPMDRAPART